MTQFKEKSGERKESANVGLFTYPPDGRRYSPLRPPIRSRGRRPAPTSGIDAGNRQKIQRPFRKNFRGAESDSGLRSPADELERSGEENVQNGAGRMSFS